MFTHLHVHSHCSFLGSTAPLPALVERARAAGMTHLALTDRNALYGAVAFSRACVAAGIAPVIGMTVDVAGADAAEADELVLLARDGAGYRSLCRVASAVQVAATRDGAPTAAPLPLLLDNAAGLICLAGGRTGRATRLLRGGDEAGAAGALLTLRDAFGAHLFLALEIHTQEDAALAAGLAALGERLGVRAAAVQPVWCMEPRERRLLRVLGAMARNCRLDDVPAAELPGGEDPAVAVHWLTPQEVAWRFRTLPAALEVAGEVAAACGPALPDGATVLWPALPLEPGESPDAALARRAATGLRARYGDDSPPAVAERLERELAAIARHGFAPLFLVVADVVAFARSRRIPVSTRGSVANSLAAYCAGITTVDPVANDLLFERFLNPARTSLPDIDLDFCSRRRDEVLEHVRAAFGEDHMALIATVSTFRPRSAVRETAKVYGLGDAATERLVALLPDAWHPDPRRRVKSGADEMLRLVRDERERQAIRDAYALVGLPDHLSVHPGGVVLTPGPLTDTVPVQWAPKGFLITQFDHGDVEAIGLPKIDLLGIRALTVLADAAELARAHGDLDFDLDAIPLDDAPTAALLARGDTVGVFQCESTGAQRTLRQLRARTVQDLAVANAFFKPGPATGGMAPAFIRRYRGEEAVRYLHPALEPILRATKGVLIFQEQILRVATEIAGLSWEEAEHLRKGMSKFRPAEMEAMRDRFIAGCRRPAPGGPAFADGDAATLWDQVRAFAGYGFNQGHATAYADVSYRSAYLRAHYPAAFLCARLADGGGYHHPAIYIAEARRLGVAVQPPHVNRSRASVTLDTGDPLPGRVQTNAGFPRSPAPFPEGEGAIIWLGLGLVRDLRRASVERIVAARGAGGPFRDLDDLLRRVPLQPKEVTHLIQCGALDGLGPSRAALLAATGRAEAPGYDQLAFDFGGLGGPPPTPPETPLQRLVWEQRLLGLPVSVHPLDLVPPLPGATPLADLPRSAGRAVTVLAARLPGWTGGKGFYVGDRTGYAVAHLPEKPPAWQPLVLTGRWMTDAWGGGMFHAERVATP